MLEEILKKYKLCFPWSEKDIEIVMEGLLKHITLEEAIIKIVEMGMIENRGKVK